MLHMVAFDLGASNYRAISGQFDGSALRTEELCRHPNLPIRADGHLRWNCDGIFEHLLTALRRAAADKGPVASIAVDTWGTDFGLIGGDGRLLTLPVVYRDEISRGTRARLEKLIPEGELYARVGCSVPDMSTIGELLGMRESGFEAYPKANRCLLMPDLFAWMFGGDDSSEYTILSSSRLIGARSRTWDRELIGLLGFPQELFGPIVGPATLTGELRPALRGDPGLSGTRVARVASHDTAAAVTTIPYREGQAFISSGTWSVMGVVLDEPILTAEAMRLGFENEGLPEHKIRLVKNIPGLYFLAECMKAWREEGIETDFPTLDAEAEQVADFRSMVVPGDPSFDQYGGMPRKIRDFCARTGQTVPETPAETLAAINQGLAMEYRRTVEELTALTGKPIDSIYIVGGGVKNKPLCRCAADVTGLPVTTGYPEAVSAGNLLLQAQALGEVGGMRQIAEIVRASFPTAEYEPCPDSRVNEAYARYLEISKIMDKGSVT